MTTEGPHSFADPAAQVAALLRENEQLRAAIRQTQSEAELLRAERAQLVEEHAREIDTLQHQLQYLLRRLFGRSAEKVDPRQLQLFETVLDELAPKTYVTPPEPAPDPESPKTSSRGHGRRRLPADLPHEKVIHDLPEEEKSCPCCGKMRHIIGQEVSEQLQFIPAKVSVIEHVRLKYACPVCQENVAVAEKPLAPIEKGLAAPGLLAYVVVSKYGDHLPLHRLESILQRHGIEIARSTMCDWAAQCATVLRPLYERMVQQVLGSRVIHTDDTPVDVLDHTRDQTRTGRFWVYLGDRAHPFTVFTYTPSRSRNGPMEFLRDWGKEQRVYLQADAFGGYDGIYAGKAGGQVTEVACWAHARRKFYDARTTAATVSTQALAYIRLLYEVENQAKEAAKRSGIDAVTEADRFHACLVGERYRLRQEFAVPRLEQLKTWLGSQRAEHGGPVLPKSPMGQAIQYALNQWDALCVYTTDGELNIDNNAAENALRRVAVGRKNWLFCGSDNGGHTAAVLFSVVATCQRHKIDPFAYLRDVLTRIAAHPVRQLDQLLPTNWTAAPAASPPPDS